MSTGGSVDVEGAVGTAAEGTAPGRLGDAEFAALYRDVAPRVHGYLARRLGPDLAEELTAEVFAQAWTSRDRYDPAQGDAAGWLFGFAVNAVRRHRRSGERQLRAYGRVPAGRDGGDPGEAVPDALDAAAELARTAAALQRLSDLDQEIILLRAWAELSYQDIARALGIDVGVVRTRLSRARARVAAAVERGGHR